MSERVVTKVCTTCHVLLSADKFHRQAANAGGLRFSCKNCRKLHDADPQRRAARRAYDSSPSTVAARKVSAASPHRKAARAAYNSSPHGMAYNKEYQKAYCATAHGQARNRAATKTYAASAAGKVTRRIKSAEWIAENPEKKAAYNIVANAVRRGRLVRPPSCSACDSTGRLHAHHDNYERPLDVRWLCQPCHSAHHAAVRQAAYLLFSKETHYDL